MNDRFSRIAMVDPAAQDRLATAAVARRFGRRAGLSPARSEELALAVAELASNVARHARDGSLVLRCCEMPRPMVEVICSDRGPGIEDLKAARQDGYSGGKLLQPGARPSQGLGLGLGAVERLMDEVQIDSELGVGTTVTARKWIP